MDLMKTVTETSRDMITAREQLHELNEQKKLDLENSLLKEALTESAEKCVRLLKELKDLQQKEAEQSRQMVEEISRNVERLQTDREVLEREMAKEIGNLCADLRKETVDKVDSIWRDYQMKIEQTLSSIIRKEELIGGQLKKQVEEVERARHRLFQFDGVKNCLFWIGIVANLGMCVFLVLEKVLT